ncbi:GNAT family N-acetyltransferase [Amycolatopsis dongchuanensis]|uniref:GNAT family N-acetyltransferase n=1 Tax=Amycolatopsis dongchuanensis TaxID=1070866 RepID=A0ABP9QTU5_9PSEU
MLELLAPTTGLRDAWLRARDDWGPGVHEDGFGIGPDDDVDSPEGFAAWVARLNDQADPARPLQDGRVHATFRWIVEDGEVLGGIALRHELTGAAARLGHIGYGIRPSARGRGIATWALGAMLDEARALGLPRVLLVCRADNSASAKTIERNGGVLESSDRVLRYWIEL